MREKIFGVAMFAVMGAVLYASVRFTGSVSSGLVVLIALGAVSLWGCFASSGTSRDDFVTNIVFALLISLGAFLIFGLVLEEATVVRGAFLAIVLAAIAGVTLFLHEGRRCKVRSKERRPVA